MVRSPLQAPLGLGILAGVVASLCCTLPLLVILLGLGSLSTALGIGLYKNYFLALGTFILAAGFLLLLRKKRSSCCSSRSAYIPLVVGAATFLVLYLFLLYVFSPWAAAWILR